MGAAALLEFFEWPFSSKEQVNIRAKPPDFRTSDGLMEKIFGQETSAPLNETSPVCLYGEQTEHHH